MADVQRAGRIGGNELDLHFLALPVGAGAVPASGVEHAGDDLLLVDLRQEQVDEAGAGDFGFFQVGRCRQRGDQLLGNFPRIAAQLLGQLQRHVAGEVAVLCRLGRSSRIAAAVPAGATCSSARRSSPASSVLASAGAVVISGL